MSLQNLTREDVLNNHKKVCLEINGDQAAEYEEGITKFSNYEKQLSIPFKIYADTECSLKNIDYQISEHTKLYQWHGLNSIAAKLVSIDDRFTKPTKIFTGKKFIKEFLEWVFETYDRCLKKNSKYFKKKLNMTLEDEENYQNSNVCHICNKKYYMIKIK